MRYLVFEELGFLHGVVRWRLSEAVLLLHDLSSTTARLKKVILWESPRYDKKEKTLRPAERGLGGKGGEGGHSRPRCLCR